MEQIYRSVFWIGIASVIISLFIDFNESISYFSLAFGIGILFIVYSLFEQYLWKKSQSLPPQAQPSAQPLQPSSQQQAAPIAKRLVPLKELSRPTSSSLSPALKPSFLARFFAHLRLRKRQSLAKPSVPIASLDNVKQLFHEDLHLQQQQLGGGMFQRPVTPVLPLHSQPVLPPQLQRPFPQQRPLPPQSQLPPFDFEEGLEHYVPTGAEQLQHDHHNRYEEDRETISQPSDQRYQQVSQQQRTLSLQQPSHHLSLLHYLHYKNKKHETILFSSLLVLSIILIIVSLILPFQAYVTFVVTLLFLGLLLLSASIAELIHLRHHVLPLPTAQPQEQQLVSSAQKPSSAQPQPTQSILSQQKPPALQPQQKQTLPSQPRETEHITTLVAYVQASLQQQYPLDTIRAAAQKSGWPDALITQALTLAQKNTSKKKKVFILVGLVVLLLILLLVLNSSDMFLLPYWLELLSGGSPQFYFIMIGVFFVTILLFVNKVRKLYRGKRIRYKVEEEQHVAEIKQELEKRPTTLIRGTYETDFDRLYRLISEKKILTLTEVAQGFNVSRKEAEEWGKILKEQGLIDLHYPTVGDLELRWKK